MAVVRHVFHTRHDFTPEFAWAAFQLLAGIGPAGMEIHELYSVAEVTSSPLVKRSDLGKLLGAMGQLGLVVHIDEHVSLSSAGETLAKTLGRYQSGFNVAIHCLYSWKWIWDGAVHASPSWSYREVCRQLLDSGGSGIEGDELVLRVVSAAAKLFRAEKISFSRSSVAGVTMWLEAQLPSLVQRIGSRIFTHTASGPMADALRLNLIALCAYNNGEASLNSQGLQLLSECFLISGHELMVHVTDFARASNEFLLIPSTPYKLVYTQSEDPFINWMIKFAKGSKLTGVSA